MYIIIKSIIDFFIALIFLPIVLFVILISAIFIKLDDGGPIFYIAERTGRFGKPFKMYKLRTMKINSPDIRLEDDSTFNSENDYRVTRFGKFARKTSIDELPQLFNVLIGNMSFVGPRPDSVSYLNQYTEEERVILTVRPGVTGYNQVINRNSVGTKEKLKNDIYYVEHFSFALDVKILFMTIASVLSSKNVYREVMPSNVERETVSATSESK